LFLTPLKTLEMRGQTEKIPIYLIECKNFYICIVQSKTQRMTRKLLFVTILLFVAIASQAQFRHIKGVKSAEAGAGMTKYGIFYYGGYAQYFSNKVYGKLSVFYEQGEDSGIKYTSMGGDIAVAYNFFKIGEGVYINGIGGLTFALDKITEGAETFDVNQKFKIGGLVGAEVEFFITDKIVFIIGADQRIVMGAEFGNYRAYYRGGLRFNL
jgi:hypothetical protein